MTLLAAGTSKPIYVSNAEKHNPAIFRRTQIEVQFDGCSVNIKGLRRPVAAMLPRLPGDTPVSREAGRTE